MSGRDKFGEAKLESKGSFGMKRCPSCSLSELITFTGTESVTRLGVEEHIGGSRLEALQWRSSFCWPALVATVCVS